jgi:hypothetical protein
MSDDDKLIKTVRVPFGPGAFGVYEIRHIEGEGYYWVTFDHTESSRVPFETAEEAEQALLAGHSA